MEPEPLARASTSAKASSVDAVCSAVAAATWAARAESRTAEVLAWSGGRDSMTWSSGASVVRARSSFMVGPRPRCGVLGRGARQVGGELVLFRRGEGDLLRGDRQRAPALRDLFDRGHCLLDGGALLLD